MGSGKIGLQIRIRVEASLHCPSKLVSRGPRTGCGGPPSSQNVVDQIVLPFVGGLVLQKGSKILLYIFSKEKPGPGPCPKAALWSLDCTSLVPAPPPFPD